MVATAALVLAAGALHSDAQSGPPGASRSGAAVSQTAYLKGSNTEAGDHFGCGGVIQGHTGQGVAISADGMTMAVGAPHESSGAVGVNGNQSDNSLFDAGAVYVFIRKGENWSQQAYLKPSNPQSSAEFGHAVALSADGNTLVVSAFWEASNAKGINGNQKDQSIPQAGAVYVFTRQGSAWTQQAYIKASNTGEAGTADTFGDGDQFGFSMALSSDGNTLAVGALTEDSAATGLNGNQADNTATSAWAGGASRPRRCRACRDGGCHLRLPGCFRGAPGRRRQSGPDRDGRWRLPQPLLAADGRRYVRACCLRAGDHGSSRHGRRAAGGRWYP